MKFSDSFYVQTKRNFYFVLFWFVYAESIVYMNRDALPPYCLLSGMWLWAYMRSKQRIYTQHIFLPYNQMTNQQMNLYVVFTICHLLFGDSLTQSNWVHVKWSYVLGLLLRLAWMVVVVVETWHFYLCQNRIVSSNSHCACITIGTMKCQMSANCEWRQYHMASAQRAADILHRMFDYLTAEQVYTRHEWNFQMN